ncbi:MAG TPA: AAA family ATPase [Chloroflexota bacterium]|nr:AAA family ATPase [Chloroflexota bacterium]
MQLASERPDLPTGTVTFLLTDVQDSTRLWEQHPDAMRQALVRHDELIEAHVAEHRGVVVRPRGEGDSRFAVFWRPSDAVAAACAIQRALVVEPWPTGAELRVRIALHTGEADLRDGDYYGSAVNRCARLRGATHGAQVVLSGVTAAHVRDGLPIGASLRDLGSHRLKDLNDPEQVFQLVHVDLPADFPALSSLNDSPNNLPLQVTTFIGRQKEIVEVNRMLLASRLLTLTGAGGSGKTRLSLHVGAEVLQQYPDGVWFVELAPLAEPGLVAQRVAATLGVRDDPAQPIARTLVSALAAKHLLLILDNCEHLIEACASLVEALIRGCPSLRVLCTSREALRIAGETVWRVPSLSLPDPALRTTARHLVQSEAVQLFVDRARAVLPEFAYTDRTAMALAEVCRRLDGLPLALELAAAQVALVGVGEISRRLEDRFRLLTRGSRTAPPRQQTLRAALTWSYELLTDPERRLFDRLAVFAGGWTVEAAEAVCGGEDIDRTDVLELVARLASKSLIVADGHEEGMRYRLLETLRQYGAEKLEASGQASAARRRHAAYYADLVIRAEPELVGPDQGHWFGRLEVEHDNIRAALLWLVEQATGGEEAEAQRAAELGLRACTVLHGFWYQRAYVVEGHDRLMALLRTAGGAPRTRARALNAAGWLAHYRGDFAGAQTLLEAAHSIFEADGDTLGAAWSSAYLGTARFRLGKWEAARADLEASLSVFRAVGDQRGTAASVGVLGALLRWSGADAERAHALVRESLDLHRALGNQEGVCRDLFLVGQFAMLSGDDAAAWAPLAESLQIAFAGGYLYWLAYLLECFAHLVARDRPTQALTLAGAAAALREREGAPSSPFWRSWFDPVLAGIRQRVGEPLGGQALAAGRALSLEQAIATALPNDAASTSGQLSGALA